MGYKSNGTGSSNLPKFLALGAGVVAVGAVVAMTVVLVKNANSKTPHYTATFVANTDPEHLGKIQGSAEKVFTDVSKLDAGYAPDALASYTFDYWCSDSALTKKATFPMTLTQNEKFYAKWSIPQATVYTISFNTDGGTPIGKYSVAKGASISRPECSKTNYELVNWHEGSKTGKVIFEKDGETYKTYTPTADITLYTEWKQVAFNVGLNLDGGKTPYVKDQVTIGGTSYPGFPMTKTIDTAPYAEKDNFVFGGWYSKATCELTDLVQFPFTPEKETILYAKWNVPVATTTLTVVAGEGEFGFLPKVGEETSDPHQREIQTSFVAYAPTAYYDPKYHDKYELEGWFTEKTKGTQVTFPIQLTENKTIYAHWKQVRFAAAIYANSKDGTTTERKLDEWDNLALVRYADIPSPQTGDIDLTGKTGSEGNINAYTLKEWYVYDLVAKKEYEGTYTKEAGNLVIPSLTSNVKINAVWEHSKYNITLHEVNSGKTELLECQTKETLGSSGPACPEGWIEEQSIFPGWYSDEACQNKIDFEKYELTGDTDFYTKSTLALGKVYLHTSYDKTSSTYNGTEDYYYAEGFEAYGSGFAARDLPFVEHKKGLGWTFTESDYATDPKDWKDPSTSDTIYNKDVEVTTGKIKPWPTGGVRPKPGYIAHLYPTYEQVEFEISFNVGDKATACANIWTGTKDSEGKAYIKQKSDIPHSTKTFSEFKGWALSEGGTALSDEQLLKTPFTEKTELYAVWEETAWTVEFKIIKGAKTYTDYETVVTQEGMTQLSSGSLSDMTTYVESESAFIRDGSQVAGWTDTVPTSDNDTYDTTLIKTSFKFNKNKTLYAIYNKKDVTLTIDLNGATFGTTTGETTITTMSGQVTSAQTWYDAVVSQVGELKAKPTDLPNFIGWQVNGASSLITYPYTLPAGSGTKAKMVWANTSKFMVTFNANSGDFYYKSNEVLKTTPLVAYTVNLEDTSLWKEDYKPTVGHVYDQAKLSIGGLSEEGKYLVRDGYKLKTNRFTINGVEVSDDYEISSTSGYIANWEAVESTKDWFKDSITTISKYATNETALKNQYAAAYKGTQANADNTRTKDANTLLGLEVKISLPTVSSDLSYYVRVIGVGQDTISGGTNKATLTFEFVDCPLFGCYAPDGSGRDARYDKSTIRNSTLPYLLNTLPSSMTSLFKTVYKPYLTDASSGKFVSCTTEKIDSTSLFILSATEYGGSSSGTASGESSHIGSYVVIYKYYESLGDDANDKRKHYIPGTTTATPCWTRTPAVAQALTEYDVCFASGESGKYGELLKYDPMSGYGIAPAFCIGVVTA